MLVADSSLLVALFDEDDAHHAKARQEAARQRSFTVPSEVLAETLGLVRYRRGRAASLLVTATLQRMPHARIAASRQTVVDLAVSSSLRGSLSYQDWIVVHTCRTTGSQPWSYDSDLRRAVKG